MSGFDLNINVMRDDLDGYRMTKTVKQQVRQKLIVLLMMQPGERTMEENIGVGLRGYLFNGFVGDQAFYSSITVKIMEQTRLYMPYIVVEDIDYAEIPEQPEAINLIIQYTIPILNELDELNITSNMGDIALRYSVTGGEWETFSVSKEVPQFTTDLSSLSDFKV